MGGKKNKQKGDTAMEQSDADRHKELGDHASAAKEFKEAIKEYSLAIELKEVDLTPQQEMAYYLSRADAYFNLEQYQNALDDCDAALIHDPSSIPAYLKTATVLDAKGERERALEVLAVASKVNPNNTTPRQLEKQIRKSMRLEEEAKQAAMKQAQEARLAKEKSKLLVKEKVPLAKLPADHPEKKKLQNYLGWLHQNKVDTSKLQIIYEDEEHREIAAAKNIKQGETVLVIPSHMLLTQEECLSTGLGKKIVSVRPYEEEKDDRENNIRRNNVLASLIIDEKRALRENAQHKSKWSVYVDTLPLDDTSDFPLSYNGQEVKLLEGSDRINIEGQIRSKLIVTEYNFLVKNVPDFSKKKISFQQYKAGILMCKSRSFNDVINGKLTDFFVPLVDMLNHSNTPEVSYSYVDGQGFVLTANRDIKLNEPINLSYGRYDTYAFYINYGFVPHPHNYDSCAVIFQGSNLMFDPIHGEMKKKALSPLYYDQSFTAERNLYKLEMQNMLGFARWITYSEKSQQPIIKSVEIAYMQFIQYAQQNPQQLTAEQTQNARFLSFKGYMSPNSIVNEINAWDYISGIVYGYEKKFPQTLEQDNALLAQDDQKRFLTFNQRNCIMFRRSEKEILKYLHDCSKLVRELAQMPKAQAVELVTQWPDDKINKKNYYLNIICALLPEQPILKKPVEAPAEEEEEEAEPEGTLNDMD